MIINDYIRLLGKQYIHSDTLRDKQPSKMENKAIKDDGSIWLSDLVCKFGTKWNGICSKVYSFCYFNLCTFICI